MVWAPFFGVFLQGEGWSPAEIGYVMTAGGAAGLLATTPMGSLTDRAHAKRALLGISILTIIFACGIIFCWKGAVSAYLSKIISCIAAAAIAPALNGITLGMTGQKDFPTRLGVNEAWSHAGNAATAFTGGIIGYFYGIAGVFLVMALTGVAALIFLAAINPGYINYDIARGQAPSQAKESNSGLFQLMTNKPLAIIALCLFFFHLGNAALLPLLGQSAVARFNVNPAFYTAATVILAQSAMILTAIWGAKLVKKQGYAPLFYLAFLALPLRGCIAGLWHNPWHIIPAQLLDEVGAGLLGVATPGIVARILSESGHINMGLGLALTAQGIGAALSATYGGLFAHYFNYSVAFMALAAAPCASLICFILGKHFNQNFAKAL